MDFHHILTVASEKQGVSAVPKRYSLAVGPPKKDPKVKGVHSAAVQAFLKRQEEEQKRKVLEEKKRKEELLAKRVELKHDRKARAMASRTKDNFCGYNGIPMEEKPKKRQGRESSSDGNTEGGEYVTRDEREEFEYSQTESENEMEEYEEKPPKSSVKPKTPLRGPPPVMNFQDLLKLAEKKQHEPVEIKVVKKAEERPMTAEELREREYLERKNKKGGVLKEKKAEKELKNVIAPSSSKKDIPQKEFINAKLSKLPIDKNPLSKGSLFSQGGTEKKAKGSVLSEKHTRLSSSKLNHTEKVEPVHKGPLKSPSNSSHIKPTASGDGKSGLNSHPHPALKTSADMILRQPSVKEHVLKKASGRIKPAPLAQEGVKLPIAKQASSSSAAGGQLTRAKSSLSSGPGRPNSSVAGHGLQDIRPGQSGNSSGLGQRNSGSNIGPGRPGSSPAVGSGRPGSSPAVGSGRPGSSPAVGSGRPGSSPTVGSGRPGSSPAVGSGRPGSSPAVGSGRPGSSPAIGSGRPGSSGPARPTSSQSVGPGRPGGSLNSGLGRGSSSGSGPGHPSSTLVRIAKPKCTVVSETISSKNLGPKQGSASVNGMRPFPQQRSGVPPQGFPRPSLPPITYKRQFDDDDDEYDSEMEDFIDDEGGPEEEISKHIKEIFGYDRNRYKDESDYALRYMESSWKEQQKEEAKSLRLGIKEDLEELKREEEELKRKKQAKKLRTH